MKTRIVLCEVFFCTVFVPILMAFQIHTVTCHSPAEHPSQKCYILYMYRAKPRWFVDTEVCVDLNGR